MQFLYAVREPVMRVHRPWFIMSPFVYIYGGNKYIEIDEDISIVVDIHADERSHKLPDDFLTD